MQPTLPRNTGNCCYNRDEVDCGYALQSEPDCIVKANLGFRYRMKVDLMSMCRFRSLCRFLGTAVMTIVALRSAQSQTITYMGVIYDQTNFDRLNIGNSGYWFPQFNAASPVAERPTGENARDALPSWAGPLNHATASIPDLPFYLTRTFSQDGPSRSKGGQPTWNTFRLPDGEIGLSGAIVDPFTAGNSNNTINRIQLNTGVPATFYFHVVTDNTSSEHDPTNRLRARGNTGEIAPGLGGGGDIEPDFSPQTADLVFNGIADVYTFRYDGFVSGDFIKLQLNGDSRGASFGGFLFDETFEPNLVPEPTSAASGLLTILLIGAAWRHRLGAVMLRP
jgi:hypothetical protein